MFVENWKSVFTYSSLYWHRLVKIIGVQIKILGSKGW